MKVLSLFSGIGGFDLGFQRAGMEVVGMCEIDKHAQKVLQRRFPDATLHTDVRKVSYERRSIDLICGGFPCQDLSVAGKRRGLDGDRSGLWFEFARIIDEAEPAWVVIENVPGLFSSSGGADFAVIIQWLAQRGYGVGWRVLDAQGFGLAQRRKRVFIVASFGDPRGCTVLLESESLQRNPKPSRAKGKDNSGATQKRLGVDVGYALRANPSASGDKGDGGLNTTLVPTIDTFAIPSKSNAITTHEGRTQFYDYSTLLPTIDTFAIQGNIIDRQHGGAHGTGIAVNAPMYTLTSTDRHGVAWHGVTDVSPTLRAEAKQSLMTGDGNINAGLAIGINGQHGQWTPLHEQSHTLSTTKVEQVAYSIGVRRLTPTECERLQGFPDGWTDGQADTQRYKQLGNAVAVPVAEWIGRRIMEATK